MTQLAIGLMSGTSLDGIDAALIRTDGEGAVERVGFHYMPYPESFRARLRAAFGRTEAEPALVEELTRRHADAVDALRRIHEAADVDLIGFHGQTVHHDPASRVTCQLGDGALLARLTGCPVVNDFRSADVAAGGQGAPLVPLYHRALAQDLERPLLVLNLGGVANVTWIGRDDSVIALDTGPGNALIDDFVMRRTGDPRDEGGRLAAAGRVDAPALARMLDHPFFAKPAPKSLDRNAFDPSPCDELSTADGAATLTAFTAAAVARALPLLPEPPRRCLAAGGGRHNDALMQALARALGIPVAPVEAVGWDGDGLEAEAFAWLAVRAREGKPLSLPTTTGVPRPLTGGRLHLPQ